MNLFNPEDLSQADLFKNHVFHQECTKTIQRIGVAIGHLEKLDDMISTLIDLGGSYYDKQVSVEDYGVVLQAMQLTMKAGLR